MPQMSPDRQSDSDTRRHPGNVLRMISLLFLRTNALEPAPLKSPDLLSVLLLPMPY